MPTRLLVAVLVLWLPTAVGAQAASDGAGDEDTPTEPSEPVLFGATAELEAPIASTHRLDPTAAGTEVAIRDRVTADARVADLLFEVPGTVVAQTGAQGSFATVGLRGAEFGQTRYLLEDLPLSGPDTGAFDLSLLPVNAFDRLEVYRGGAPAWLSSGAIGGVVRLVPRSHQSDRVRTSLSTGSFGTWRTDAEAAVSTSAVRAVGSVGLATTRGDYSYLYDLPDKRSDEDIRQRRNAENLGAHGLLYLSSDVGDRGRLSAVVLGVSRQGGAPGARSASGPPHPPERYLATLDDRLFARARRSPSSVRSGRRIPTPSLLRPLWRDWPFAKRRPTIVLRTHSCARHRSSSWRRGSI